jgi:hypothetical protein
MPRGKTVLRKAIRMFWEALATSPARRRRKCGDAAGQKPGITAMVCSDPGRSDALDGTPGGSGGGQAQAGSPRRVGETLDRGTGGLPGREAGLSARHVFHLSGWSPRLTRPRTTSLSRHGFKSWFSSRTPIVSRPMCERRFQPSLASRPSGIANTDGAGPPICSA